MCCGFVPFPCHVNMDGVVGAEGVQGQLSLPDVGFDLSPGAVDI